MDVLTIRNRKPLNEVNNQLLLSIQTNLKRVPQTVSKAKNLVTPIKKDFNNGGLSKPQKFKRADSDQL